MMSKKTSWKFACTTAGGLLAVAAGVHVVANPGEWVSYVADGVREVMPERQNDAAQVSSAE